MWLLFKWKTDQKIDSFCPKHLQKYARFMSICLSVIIEERLFTRMQISLIGKGRLKDEDEQACQHDCQHNIQIPQNYENPNDLCKNGSFNIFF